MKHLRLVAELAAIERQRWDAMLAELVASGVPLNTSVTVIGQAHNANSASALQTASLVAESPHIELLDIDHSITPQYSTVESLTYMRGPVLDVRSAGAPGTAYDSLVVADGAKALYKLDEDPATNPVDATAINGAGSWVGNLHAWDIPVPEIKPGAQEGHSFAWVSTSDYGEFQAGFAAAIASGVSYTAESVFKVDSPYDGGAVVGLRDNDFGTDHILWAKNGQLIHSGQGIVGGTWDLPADFQYGRFHHVAWHWVYGSYVEVFLDGQSLGRRSHSNTHFGFTGIGAGQFRGTVSSWGAYRPDVGGTIEVTRVAVYEYLLAPDQIMAHASAMDSRGDVLTFTDSAVKQQIARPGFRTAVETLGTSDSVSSFAIKSRSAGSHTNYDYTTVSIEKFEARRFFQFSEFINTVTIPNAFDYGADDIDEGWSGGQYGTGGVNVNDGHRSWTPSTTEIALGSQYIFQNVSPTTHGKFARSGRRQGSQSQMASGNLPALSIDNIGSIVGGFKPFTLAFQFTFMPHGWLEGTNYRDLYAWFYNAPEDSNASYPASLLEMYQADVRGSVPGKIKITSGVYGAGGINAPDWDDQSPSYPDIDYWWKSAISSMGGNPQSLSAAPTMLFILTYDGERVTARVGHQKMGWLNLDGNENLYDLLHTLPNGFPNYSSIIVGFGGSLTSQSYGNRGTNASFPIEGQDWAVGGLGLYDYAFTREQQQELLNSLAPAWDKLNFTDAATTTKRTYQAGDVLGTDDGPVNWISNPGGEVDASGYGNPITGIVYPSAGTASRVTTDSRAGAASVEVVNSAGANVANNYFWCGPNDFMPCRPGDVLSVRASLKWRGYSGNAAASRVTVCYFDSAGNLVTASDLSGAGAATVDTWYDFAQLVTVPTLPQYSSIVSARLTASNLWLTGQTASIRWDQVMLTKSSSVLPYADGDTAGWYWLGTPGKSRAQKGAAVAIVNEHLAQDYLNFYDTIAVQTHSYRAFDVLGTRDMATTPLQVALAAADTLGTSDSAFSPNAAIRTTTDTLGTSDTATRLALALTRTAAETLGTNDAATRAALSRARAAADSLATSDAATRAASTRVRSAADSLGTSDAATRAAAIRTRTTTDSLGTSDSATRTGYFTRLTAGDSLIFTDATTRAAATRVRTASDALVFTDVATVLGSGVSARTAADSLGTSDSAARTAKLLGHTASDTLGTTDAATRAAGIRTRSSSDTLGTSDVATRIAIYARSTTDTLGTTDTAASLRFLVRTTRDLLYTTDEYRNLAGNPSAEGTNGTNPAFWAQNGGGITWVVDNTVSLFGSSSLRVDAPGGGALNGVTALGISNPGGGMVIGQGELYAISFYIKGNAGGEPIQVVASERLPNAAGIADNNVSQIVLTTGWQRYTDTYRITSPLAHNLRIKIGNAGAAPPGTATWWLDGLLVMRGDQFVAYFDGANGGHWLGGANSSESETPIAARIASLLRTAADTLGTSDAATRVQSFLRSAADALGTSDTASRAAAVRTRSATDSLGTSDTATRATATRVRSTTDSLGTSDAAARVGLGSRTTTDTLGTSDTATRAAAARVRSAADTLGTSDTATRVEQVARTTADSLGTSDAATRATATRVRSTTDTLGTSDAATRSVTGARTAADTLGTSDSASRAAATRARTATDSLGTSDTASRAATLVRAASDALNFTDAASRAAATRTRTATDALVFTDAATTASLRTATASDSLIFTDATARSLLTSRTTADTLGTTDAATRAVATRVRTATDTLGTTDTATRAAATLTRSATDTLGTSDAAMRAATAVTRTATDTLGTSDSTTRAAATRTRTAADSLIFTDAATRVGGPARTATDALVFTDAATRAATTRTRTATDSLGTSDAATRTDTYTRTATDSLGTSDAATRGAAVRARTSSDVLGTTDVATRIATYPRVAQDTLGTSDAVQRAALARTRTAADTLGTTDAATSLRSFTRSAADTLGTTDAATRVASRHATAADTLIFTDAASRVAAVARTSNDALLTSDSASRATATRVRTAADSLTFTDAATRTGTATRVAADALGTHDAATRAIGLTRTAADSLIFTDAATQHGLFARITADALVFTDATTRAAVLRVRFVTDALVFTDVATIAAEGSRSASDTLGTSDTATRISHQHLSAADAVGTSDSATRTASLRARSSSDTLGTSDVPTRITTYLRSSSDQLGTTDEAIRVAKFTLMASDTLGTSDTAILYGGVFARTTADTLGTTDEAVNVVIGAGPGTATIRDFSPYATQTRDYESVVVRDFTAVTAESNPTILDRTG